MKRQSKKRERKKDRTSIENLRGLHFQGGEFTGVRDNGTSQQRGCPLSLSISSSFSLPLLLLPHKSQLVGSLSGEMKEGHGILMGGLTDKRRR